MLSDEDKGALMAWDVYKALLDTRCNIEQIPKEQRPEQIKKALERIEEIDNALGDLIKKERFADAKYLETLASICERYCTYTKTVDRLVVDYQAAAQTYFYNVQREELSKTQQENELLKKQLVASEKALQGYINLKLLSSKEDNVQKTILTLCPTITPTQIVVLWQRLKHIFRCELDQFNRLFEYSIKKEVPPITTPTITDAAVFVHFLKSYGLITTGKPWKVLERVKAFEFSGKVITAKQYKKPLEYYKFPYSGKYCSEIEDVIKAVASL